MWAAVHHFSKGQKRSESWNGLETYVFNTGNRYHGRWNFLWEKAPPRCVLSISGIVTIQTRFFSTLVAHSWRYQIMLISQLNSIFFFYLLRSVLCRSLGLLQRLMVWIKVSLNNDMTALAEWLCPVVELPSRYPQVIIWSQLTWIAFSMLLHSDLFLHHSLSRRPSLALSLSSNICSSTIWWRNLIRAEGRRLERTRDTVKERSGVIMNGR